MDFSAKEPSLGYLYQIRYGLYLLLTSKQEENTKILIESLDDIEIQNNDHVSLYQTKYHKKRNKKLSDRSTDFWKTIRVWCEQINDKTVPLDKAIFTLVTTESIANKSIINDIKNNTDISKTIDELNTISKESNKSNDKGYKAFNLLSDSQKIELIEKIQIIDASFDFSCVVEKIKKELRLSVLPKNITPLFERLEGWFLCQTIKHLQDRKHHISFNELQKAILYISGKFKSDSLPIDFPDKIIKSNDTVKSMTFVKQLSLIDSTKRTKQNAISDYYRAYYQRSKWITNELLDPQEEIDFEKRLIDDWERKFDLLLDEVEGKNKVECSRDAQKFYTTLYITNVPQIFIRERFTEIYLTLGSCHILSQDLKIGWHPNFKELLR